MEIKEKWKTDVRKLTIEMETQAAPNIINEKNDHCLKKKYPASEGLNESSIFIMVCLK